jgi:succinate dehydrogenase/fumarate reductase flavoprotein subunit
MKREKTRIDGKEIPVISLNTVIVGTGAAGYNAADSLYSLGQKDIAIVTEGIGMGTSRNTGSDKQTYYKLTQSGEAPDSVLDMAKTLFSGGSMQGEIALIEAALSSRCFYKLVQIGVPFPHNRFGEYVGYKTDHDPRQRATSAGPLTSRFMTEKLEVQVRQKGIQIFDRHQVIGILTAVDELGQKKTAGLIALDLMGLEAGQTGIVLFNCKNIIYATGGPAGMYLTSVYPESQTGASGIAFEAGAAGVNLTESQYGIASVTFRWNLSGTYQQVLPRYISSNPDGGDEREFLQDYFETPGQMLDAVFLKGYQWPFDPRKIHGYGSSLIDLLVYQEREVKGRRVFLDFTRNPSWGSQGGELDFRLLGKESLNYLEKSDALFGTPIDRLAKMNEPAIQLYASNGIDLRKEYLEIAVCAQHNNGGLQGNLWWESNIRGFFPVGEVNGSFGVYRPGGSALNSTQVGSLRAAQFIAENYSGDAPEMSDFSCAVEQQVVHRMTMANRALARLDSHSNMSEVRQRVQGRMTRCGAHIRSLAEVCEGIDACRSEIASFTEQIHISSREQLGEVFRLWDILLCQYVYLCAIREYIEKGGKSRGSYLIQDAGGSLPGSRLSEDFRFSLEDGSFSHRICRMELLMENNVPTCKAEWIPIRTIPEEESWYETVWSDFRGKKVFR